MVLTKGKELFSRYKVACCVLIVAACFILGVIAGGCANEEQPIGGSASSAAQASVSASTSESQQEANPSSESTSSSGGKKASSSSSEKPNRNKLAGLLGKDIADKLIKQASENEDAAWVATHPDAYGVFREHIQRKALTLAANEPEAAAFVRGLPKKFPASKANYKAKGMPTGAPGKKVPSTKVPHLYQWDLRWGYTMYDGDSFGLSGCGPTSMAMVYQGLTGDADKTPYDMGQLAFEGDFVDPNYGGTYDGYYLYAAEQLGLLYEGLPVDVDSIVAALDGGRVVIAHVGPGTFSQVGHYIVLAGLTDSGEVIVNDPYSTTRSAKPWDADLIASESIALYAYGTES